MTNPNLSDDLTLTAFQYVSGELTTEESQAFEALLATELDAQQALADVVLIRDAMSGAAIGGEPRLDSSRLVSEKQPFRLGRLAVGAAAVAVVCTVIGLWTGFPGGRRAIVNNDSLGPAQGDLAERADSIVSVWSELGSDDRLDAADEPTEDEAAAEEFPDWLMSAVTTGSDDAESSPQPDDFEFDDELDEDAS